MRWYGSQSAPCCRSSSDRDRRFLSALTNRVLELGPGGAAIQYGGGYTEYVQKSGHEAPGLRT